MTALGRPRKALTLGVVVGELVLGVPPRVAGAVSIADGDPLVPLLLDHLRAGRLAGLGLLRKACTATPHHGFPRRPRASVVSQDWSSSEDDLLHSRGSLTPVPAIGESVGDSATDNRSGSCEPECRLCSTSRIAAMRVKLRARMQSQSSVRWPMRLGAHGQDRSWSRAWRC